MSVIVAVRKGAMAAIAADTQFSQGSICIPGDGRSYPAKIVSIGGGFLGVPGSTAHLSVLRSLSREHPEIFDFSSGDHIFETFRKLHPILRDDYYVMTKEDDENQEYESNQMHGLVLSPAGLFSFQGYREISEYRHFWASGAGMEVALGALAVQYETERNAREIAIEAVEVACKFNTTCGLPVECHELAIGT